MVRANPPRRKTTRRRKAAPKSNVLHAVIAGAGTAAAITALAKTDYYKKQQSKNANMVSGATIVGVAALGYFAKKRRMPAASAALTGVAAYIAGQWAMQTYASKQQTAGMMGIPGYARAAFPQSNNTYYHLPNQMGAVGADLGAVGADLGAVQAQLNGMSAHVS